MAANKIKINVSGSDYTIISEEDPKYVQFLGNELNTKMAEVMKGNSCLSVTQAAVLAALDYSDESKRAVVTADRLREQIKDYLDDAAGAKSKADIARHESEKLRKELEAVRAENARLKKELQAMRNS